MPGKPALGDLISSFQLSKSIVDVSSTDFAGPVDDPILIVADIPNGYISTTWQSPSGAKDLWISSQDSGHSSYELNKYSENGTWSLTSANASLYGGGYHEYNENDFKDLGFQTEFNVIGGLSDTTPPKIISLDYSADVFDVSDLDSSQSISFSFTAKVSDDLSGVKGIYGEWNSPSGNQEIEAEYGYYGTEDGQIISGNKNYGDFESDSAKYNAQLDRRSEPGAWILDSLSVTDFSENTIKYDMYDFIELGLPYSFEVVNSRMPSKDHSSEQQIVNNVTNVVNEITNNTTVNIENSGSGNVTVGSIGSVNNTTMIDNSFAIQTANINLSLAITGDSKKSEKVEGTDGDDLIADGRGKDKLIGGDGADQFYFSGEEPFKKKTVDKVIDFDASEGDAIVIADEVVGDLNEDPTLAIADTKKELKQLSKYGYDLLYFEPKGDLYVDGNGDSKGFGKKSEGGMIADLPNDTILSESDVLIGV